MSLQTTRPIRTSHATALRVNSPPRAQATGSDAVGSLRRRHALGVDRDTDLAAEQIQKDRDPVAVLHAFIKTETVGECAVQNADLVTGTKLRPLIEADESAVVLARLERVDDAVRDRCREIRRCRPAATRRRSRRSSASAAPSRRRRRTDSAGTDDAATVSTRRACRRRFK